MAGEWPVVRLWYSSGLATATTWMWLGMMEVRLGWPVGRVPLPSRKKSPL